MRVRRLYSNEDTVFEPIVFNRGLSAVVAEIRRPSNRMLDTHNLGKSTVGQLLDYWSAGKPRNSRMDQAKSHFDRANRSDGGSRLGS